MTIQMLNLKGERYVLLREKDFRALSRKASGSNGRSKKPPRLTAQDRGDIAEAMRRKSDPKDRSLPYEQARKRLGLA